MPLMDHDQQPRPGGMGRFLVIGAAALAVLAVAYVGVTMLMRPEPKAEPVQAKTEAPPPAPAAKPAEPEQPADTSAPRRATCCLRLSRAISAERNSFPTR